MPTPELSATCEDTVGPYYPYSFTDWDRSDLSVVHPGLVLRPHGDVIEIRGRLSDVNGNPAYGALLEFWQADSRGRYLAPSTQGDSTMDPHFPGMARIHAIDGSFVLRTIRPGAEPGRAPCVTLTVFSDGISRIVTQLFLDGEPGNDTDPVLAAVPERLRSRLVAKKTGQSPDGTTVYTIDLVMAGDRETPFFEDLHAVGRVLGIGPTDRTSQERTPRKRLLLIPETARHSFVPWLEPGSLPNPRAGENDLTRLTPGRPRAAGEAIEITGRITDSAGHAQTGVLVEVWNANSHGRYTHVEDNHDYRLDPLFLGFGRAVTDADGGYRFWTVMPGHYIARPDINRWRPAHIHFSIRGGSSRLITQMYFDGDPYNDTDPMRVLMGDDFVRQIGTPTVVSSPEVSRAFRFDIVVGGRNAMFFEDDR